MKAKPDTLIEQSSVNSIASAEKGSMKEPKVTGSTYGEWGIINPFRKEPKNNDRCGINREKNPCGDASDY